MKKILDFPSAPKPDGPQPPTFPAFQRRPKSVPKGMLEQNKEKLFWFFRRGTLPRSLAAKFQISEWEVCAVINEQIDRRLDQARAMKAAA